MKVLSTHSVSFQSSFLVIILLTSLRFIAGDDDVISKLFSGYDKAIGPDFGKGKPITIFASIFIESFGNIEEANMEYRVYSYFRQSWKDPRLAGKFNSTFTIKGGEIDNLWVPDPYCYNARESNMMMPDEEIHTFVRIEPSGDLLYSKGVNLLASCVMDLRHFPLDSQECSLKFGSYAYTTRDIIYEWVAGATEVVVGNTEMAQFEYKGSKLKSGVVVVDTGNFSTITATFSFQRRIGYFLIQVYFPTIFVVTLSWIVFWMEKDDIGNRMALGITTVLTIMFLLGSLSGDLPKVSYPKALDWYLLVSFSFVFLTLIECMIVYLFAKRGKQDEDQMKFKKDKIPLSKRMSLSFKSLIGSRNDVNSPSANGDINGGTNMGSDDIEMAYRATKANKAVVDDGPFDSSTKNKKMSKIADAIDNASRVLFPSAFIVYNIFYWTYY
ncbi:hypothetical protein ACROYT_G032800 [Oculina patagonica]